MIKYTDLPEAIKEKLPPESIFDMVHGEVNKVFKSEANGKEYLIMDCTKNPVIDLPRPDTIEDFDRYYHPALMSILNKMLDK